MKRLLAAAMLAAAAPALAAGPCGADAMVTMRVSVLTPKGTPAGFMDAVRDHKAWYAGHGFRDDVFATGPALVGEGNALERSSRKFVTFHTYGSEANPKHDSAWDAYVAKYKANATIESEQRFCLPRGATIGR